MLRTQFKILILVLPSAFVSFVQRVCATGRRECVKGGPLTGRHLGLPLLDNLGRKKSQSTNMNRLRWGQCSCPHISHPTSGRWLRAMWRLFLLSQALDAVFIYLFFYAGLLCGLSAAVAACVPSISRDLHWSHFCTVARQKLCMERWATWCESLKMSLPLGRINDVLSQYRPLTVGLDGSQKTNINDAYFAARIEIE